MPRKIIISGSIPKYLLFFIPKKDSYSINEFVPKNFKINYLRDDIFTYADKRGCDHNASLIENELFDRFVPECLSRIYSSWGGEVFSKYFLGLRLIKEAQIVFTNCKFVDRAMEELNINEKVYIFPSSLNLKIFRFLSKRNYISKFIKIHPLAYVYISIMNTVRFIFFLTYFLLLPEIKLLLANKKITLSSSSFKSIVHLEDGICSFNPKISDKFIEKYSADDLVFVNESFFRQKWPSYERKNLLNIFDYKESHKHINKFKYFKSVYKSVAVYRNKFFLLSINNHIFVKDFFNFIRLLNFWLIFYSTYSAKTSIKFMTCEELPSAIIHKNNETKTVFTYFSFSDVTTNQIVDKNVSSCHEYTHMIQDYMIGNKISNTFFKTLQNSIREYIDQPSWFFNLINLTKEEKKENLNLISRKQFKCVVTIFDTTLGHTGIRVHEDYLIFIKSIINLSSSNKDILFIFKTKAERIVNRYSDQVIKLIDQLKKRENFLFIEHNKYSSFELLSLSDLVIALYNSSIIYESLFSGKKLIVFDPNRRLKNFHSVINESQFYAGDPHQLRLKFNEYLKSTKIFKDINRFSKKHISSSNNKLCEDDYFNIIDKIIKG